MDPDRFQTRHKITQVVSYLYTRCTDRQINPEFKTFWPFRTPSASTKRNKGAAFGGRLNCAIGNSKQQKLLADILDFVSRTSGLKTVPTSDNSSGKNRIHQALDNKYIDFTIDNLEEVLLRSDTEGQEFIQVNFCTGQKILLTDTLIGFKPVVPKGLDASKLPRVVTTPDIASVFEAIQDALDGSSSDEHEIQVLRRVFDAVVSGGEAVGFNLSTERSWIIRIPSNLAKLAS